MSNWSYETATRYFLQLTDLDGNRVRIDAAAVEAITHAKRGSGAVVESASGRRWEVREKPDKVMQALIDGARLKPGESA